MYPLGLRSTDKRAFHAALRDHRNLHVRVYVLNMAHEHIADLSEAFDDGQVNIDADAEVTRSTTLSFTDRGRTMDFDSDSPSDGALFANRMIRVEYRVKVDSLNDWVEVPIFTGPVTSLDRTGDTVNVECQGKETLAMGAAWEPLTIKKGHPKVDAIRQIMRERGGEDHFSLPDLKARLPKAVSLARESVPWSAASKIAESMDRQLFYNGAGRLCLRTPPGNDVYTFSDGDDGELLTEPQVSFSVDEVKNIVWVKGGKPKATRRKNETRAEFETRQEKMRGVRHTETAPHSHPLSPWRLGRDNAPRYLLEVVENDHVRSEKEARQLAHRTLTKKLEQGVDVTFDALVIPHIEESDLVQVRTDLFAMSFRIRQASIPLKHDGVMAIGYHKRVSSRHRRANKHRHPGRKGGKR